MGGPSIMKRIISAIGRNSGKGDTEFAREGGPILKKRIGRQARPGSGGNSGTAGDVYSKQEKMQEGE